MVLNRSNCFLLAVLLGMNGLADAQGPPPPPPPPPPPQGLPPVPVPPENPITEAKRVLGKILFWEEQLSSDDTIACGTCHIPSSGGAEPRTGIHPGLDAVFGTDDDVVGSPGVVRRNISGTVISDPVFGTEPQVTGRAAPTFMMGIFADENFWDGRAGEEFVDPEDGVTVVIANGGSLENQAVGPILSSVEMAKDGRTWDDVRTKLQSATPLTLARNIPPDMANALQANPTYPDLFANAFGDSTITAVRIAFAIATYERTLVPDQTPWDRFIAGDANAMTPNEIEGWNLLRNDTVCTRCHRPPTFSGDNFRNIGLRPSNEDLGRFTVTGNNNDRGEFKTPSLRNVGLKTSLMHVGWITDVADAVDFYNSGAENNGHVQFTADQDNVPNIGPGPDMNFGDILVPNLTQGGQPFKARVIEFLNTGLTDPRVGAETYPFDRPTLRSEIYVFAPSPFAMPVASPWMNLLGCLLLGFSGVFFLFGRHNTLD
jgi:cytochrome c peroxidase